MRFEDFINKNEKLNSSYVIKQSLSEAGYGLEKIRQIKSEDNTKTVIYKMNGFPVEGVWITEDGPYESEGYSEQDGLEKLKNIIKELEELGGTVKKTGTISSGDKSIIKYEEFTINIVPIKLNSAADGSGYERRYLKFETE